MRIVLGILLAACGSAEQHAPPPAPSPEPSLGFSFLRWDVTKAAENRVQLGRVSWIDEKDKVVWTKDLDGPIGKLSVCCWDDNTDAYVAKPRGSLWPGASLTPVETDHEVLIEDEGQLIVVAKKTGATVFEWTDDRDRSVPDADGPLVFDDGRLDITIAGQTCHFAPGRGNFIVPCGAFAILYDTTTLALFKTQPWALVTKRTVKGTHQDCQTPELHVDRTEKVGDATVHFDGRRLTMCMN